jgi:membrane-anchored glycerophosphoryl diester phosphodiesterase (GDPDase)
MKNFFGGTKDWFFTVMKPFGLMKKSFGNIIAFEVNFRLFTFFVLFPTMTCLERLWLVGNKTTVITWANLFDIIKNPFTWVVLILLGLLLVAGTMFEQFALYDTLHACKCGQKRTLKQIFSAGFDLWAERLSVENLLLLPYTILVLRFGTLTGDVSSVVTVLKIPGFILEDFHKHNWEKVAFLCFQVIAIYCFLRWIYSIPVMMEEDEKSFVTACKKSAAMTKGKHVIKVGFIALGWLLLVCFLYYAGTAAIVGIWFLLSIWLMPGQTPNFNTFFAQRFTPTGTLY